MFLKNVITYVADVAIKKILFVYSIICISTLQVCINIKYKNELNKTKDS